MGRKPRGAERLGIGLALGGIAGLMLAGCGGSSSGGGGSSSSITIAYLQKQGDQQYFIDEAAGGKAAADAAGAKLLVQNLHMDSNGAVNTLDTVLGQGVDGVVIVVPDQKIGPTVIQKANDKNVPIMASDDAIKDSAGKAAPFTGFDGVSMGTKVGTKAGELFKAGNWAGQKVGVLDIQNPGLSVCVDRTNAATTAFQTASGATPGTGFQLFHPQNPNNDSPSSNAVIAATITAHPDIQKWVVWGCNDETVQGAVRALDAHTDPANVIAVGLGAYLACQDWQANKPSGFKAALFIDGKEVGKDAVTALIAKVKDKKDLPLKTVAKTTMVDPSNWKQAGLVCH